MLKRLHRLDVAGVLLPALLLLAGVAASAAGAWWLNDRSQAQAHAEFARVVIRSSDEISERFRLPVYGLTGARGLYATHAGVTRDIFRRYVASRNLSSEFPGVRGFGFVQPVQRKGLDAFIASARGDGAPAFAVHPLAPPNADDLYVIKFMEPLAENASALGLDVGSEAIRRQGVLLALETGEATTSGMITLVQDERHRPGVLLFLPVYGAALGADPIAPRPLLGLLFAPMVISDLLRGLVDEISQQVRVELFDTASGVATGPLMFDSASEAGNTAAGRFEIVRPVDVPGRLLTLRVRSLPAFDAAHQSREAWLVATIGSFASLLLAALLRQQVIGRSRAESRAKQMTTDLGRLALVARRTSNAVVITDLQRRITWVNDGFERITGYSQAEALGQPPARLVQCERTDPATLQAMRAALNAGQGFRGEVLNRAKDGSHHWLDIDIQPLHDDQGAHIGFMAIEADITERKQAERALSREQLSLRNIIEGTQVGTWEWNVETGHTVFNERWAQIAGYTLDELNPTTIETWTQRSHPDDQRQAAMLLERHFDGLTEGFESELRLRHKAGHWVWVMDRGKLFSRSDDGRPRWMAGTRMDITQRKQAEIALRASQAFLQQTGRVGGVGGWSLDIVTQTLTWSDETCRIHEVEPGHRPTLQEATSYYAAEAQSAMQEAMAEGISSGLGWDLEVPLVTARGRSIWVRAVGEAEMDAGTPVRLFGAFQDITAHRAMEAELRAKNDLVNSIIENLPCGLSVFDGNLTLLAANREFRRLLEFPDALLDRPTVTFEDVIRFNAERGEYGPGDVEATIQAIVSRARGPQQPHQFERTRPDGTPLEVRGGPMPGGGFVTTYTDISARKAAEAEVKRSASLLRGAIDAIDEAFVLFDPQGRLVLCNEKYRQIYPSVAHLMVPGVLFEDLIRPGAQAGDYVEAIGRVDAWVAERVAAHRSANITLVQPLANGRTLRIVERKLPDGHIVGFRVDITELVRSTQEAQRATLEASRALARLQAIYDILPVGLTLTDKQGHIVDCNPASERLLGITKAQHLARAYDDRDWTILREDGTPMPAEEFASVRALTQQTAVHDAVMQVVTPSSKVWLSVSAMPVQHEELGVVIGYVDITEQRAQSAALLQAKAEAEQASVSKSQFLANMSHEIRTPMNAILGMLTLLRKTELNSRQADYAAKTEGAARSLLGLLNDILDFSKVEAGKMALDPHPFRFDQLLRDLGVILGANAGSKPLEVLYHIDPDLPRHLLGDAMRLQQVLINLAGNAIKFTPAGEVVISVRVVQRRAEEVTLCMAVRDTGIGIAPENQARIFSGFTQAEASTTRRFGGTGLGVAISQRLVGLMGGELTLESVLGQGTTFSFTLTLPIVAEPDAQPDGKALSGAPGHVLRALVVDDNPTAREVLQHMTQALGWTADIADSGQAALDLLAARQAEGLGYDAVFVDWQMPGLDGWQTAARIRAEGLAADTPLVVMVTAHGREKLEARSVVDQQLLDGFLVKPVTASMLLDAVADARQGRGQPQLSAMVGPPTSRDVVRLAGLRLLIVEDNLNNQQVARELLEGEGATVQIANNGQEGVEAVAAADPPFDVVLMDLQMPVMDGFTATARIRQDLGKASLPIVAMTANAMPSDREACLAAGMNDHVGKPFDLDRLVALLLRTSGRDSIVQSHAADATESVALPAGLMQAAMAAGVDLVAALKRMGGKQAVFTRMLRNGLPEFEALPERLERQLANGNAQEAGRTLHTLKGVAATLGATKLSERAGIAEKTLADDGTPEARAAHAAAANAATAALRAAMPALRALLEQLLAAESVATPDAAVAAANPAALHAALLELSGLLQNFDMRATELVATLRQLGGATLGAQVRALDEAVGSLDFERATPLCQELLALTQS
jgi:PAS domain S-box-containing protein